MTNGLIKGTLAVAVAMSVLTGCGKKAAEDTGAPSAPTPKAAGAEAPVAPGKEVLPGTSAIRAAVAKKDYETAVGALLALKGAATQSPQAEEYMNLYGEVKGALLDAGPNDQKAQAALAMLRGASAGR